MTDFYERVRKSCFFGGLGEEMHRALLALADFEVTPNFITAITQREEKYDLSTYSAFIEELKDYIAKAATSTPTASAPNPEAPDAE